MVEDNRIFTEEDELIFSTDEAEEIFALGGNDIIVSSGNDSLNGGTCNDTVTSVDDSNPAFGFSRGDIDTFINWVYLWIPYPLL